MKLAQKSLLRIEKMLKFDKERVSQPLLSLLKSDIYSVFDSYFETSLEDICISYFAVCEVIRKCQFSGYITLNYRTIPPVRKFVF